MPVESAESLHCEHCGWDRLIGPDDWAAGIPSRCLACGCEDLWRQKDFPQGVGLLLVAMGALLSTIAWAYHRPVLAIGTLLAFAAGDLALFLFMKDVLVCYRCAARFNKAELGNARTEFNLETAERYRQEAKRFDEAANREM